MCRFTLNDDAIEAGGYEVGQPETTCLGITDGASYQGFGVG
jgi:hypothetical protein